MLHEKSLPLMFREMYESNGQPFASFRSFRTNELVSIPVAPEKVSLLARVLSGTHTTKMKPDGKITIRFMMEMDVSFEKLDRLETFYIVPREGDEELFDWSDLIRTTSYGKAERQITLSGPITKEPDLMFQQFWGVDPSDR